MNETKQSFGVPAAIVIAGVFIAGAIFLTNNKSTLQKPSNNTATAPSGKLIPFDPKTDHVLGNPNASVIILEYSDIECPYCKLFHQTMQKIMAEFGTDGKVAWVYRHLPLHTNAPREALATECAAEQGGNTKFWEYLNKIYDATPSNNGLDLAKLPAIAESVGLDKAKFEQCMASGKLQAKIDKHASEAQASGARGTPFDFVIAGGESIELGGALPYENLKTIITQALKK